MPKNQPKIPGTKIRIEATRHDEVRRTNIPTTELGSFLSDQEKEPKTIFYPRDPSLDPQLVWKGKDEQNQHPLEVPAVPIYIQEKIHPKALIEALRVERSEAEPQLNLWGDFDGIQFEDLVEFYKHEQNWSNRLILGDSLLVMTSLAEKEALKGKVQMIYMDPPYGIKFGSNWQVSTRKRDVHDGRAEDATRQPEQVKAFRDTWELGIHSYLSYLRDRLSVAHELLAATGSVFVQIGDENMHVVRCLMDEIFGADNFVSVISFRKKTMPFGTNFIEQMHDFIIWYTKSKEDALGRYRRLFLAQAGEPDNDWCWYEQPDGSRHRMTKEQVVGTSSLPERSRIFRLKSLEPSGTNAGGHFQVEFEGKIYLPPKRGYGTGPANMEKLIQARRIQPKGGLLNYVLFHDDYPVTVLTSPWSDTVGPQDKRYVVQTSDEVVKRCLLMTTDPGDLVLDPTCGSGTTALVAEQWGRRWITIDTSRVALALTRQRLMAATLPYYILADSPEGSQLLAEQ